MEYQKTSLQNGQGHRFFFSAYYVEHESAELKSLKSDIAASFLSAAGLHHSLRWIDIICCFEMVDACWYCDNLG